MAENTGNSNSNRGKGLIPFQKGKSGNPNGRPKVPESVKLAFSGMMPLALDALRNVLNGTDEDAGAKDRLRAAELVFDRHLGKPLQSVDMNGSMTTANIDTSKLPKNEQDALLNAIVGLVGTVNTADDETDNQD